MGSAPHSGQQVQLFECSLLGLVSNGALPTLLDRLVAVCGDVRRGVKPDFEEHEIAFGPAAAPSFEGGKADDLMVRLRSSCLDPNTGERIVNLEHREWRMSSYGNPDPRDANSVLRPIITTPVKGAVFDFLDGLGLRYLFDYTRTGYFFLWDGNMRVTVTKTNRLSTPMDIRTASSLDEQHWVIEVTSALSPLAEVPQVERRLKALAEHLSGLVELKVPDPKTMQHRLPP